MYNGTGYTHTLVAGGDAKKRCTVHTVPHHYIRFTQICDQTTDSNPIAPKKLSKTKKTQASIASIYIGTYTYTYAYVYV